MISPEFPTDKLCSIINQERLLFQTCDLGGDLYSNLLTDLTVPEAVTTWSKSKTYGVNDVVEYYGTTLKSLTSSNTLEPCLDTAGTVWEVLPKFTTESLNELWCNYLQPFLAYRIIGDNVTILTYHLGGKGLTKYSEEFRQNTGGLITVDPQERYSYQNAMLKAADTYLDGVFTWLKNNGAAVPIIANTQYYKSCSSCTSGTVRRTRRMAFQKKR